MNSQFLFLIILGINYIILEKIFCVDSKKFKFNTYKWLNVCVGFNIPMFGVQDFPQNKNHHNNYTWVQYYAL